MRVLPFLFLSVALIPIVNAQELLIVREHNLTYYLSLENFHVDEHLVFEKPGGPFTFEGEVYFLRGNAWNVRVEGFPYKVIEGPPTRISLKFMISTGQKKMVSLGYERSDLLSEEDGVHIFEGLALGSYKWPVKKAKIRFVAPEGYQFGRYVPSTGIVTKGEREVLTYTLSTIENLSALLQGFPVRIEYANYKDLAIREIELSRLLISTAEFEVEMGNITLRKLSLAGENVTLYESVYSLSLAALKDAQTNLIRAFDYKNKKKYYEAFASAKAAGRLSRLAIDEARKLRAAEKMLSTIEEEKAAESEAATPEEKVGMKKVGEDKGESDKEVIPPIYIIMAAMILLAAFLIAFVRGWRRIEEKKEVSGVVLRKPSESFEKGLQRIKRRKDMAERIRGLMNDRLELERELRDVQKSLASGWITEKEYTRRRYNILRKMGRLDAEMSKLEVELERLKKEDSR